MGPRDTWFHVYQRERRREHRDWKAQTPPGRAQFAAPRLRADGGRHGESPSTCRLDALERMTPKPSNLGVPNACSGPGPNRHCACAGVSVGLRFSHLPATRRRRHPRPDTAADHLPGKHHPAERPRHVCSGDDVLADPRGGLLPDRRLRPAVGHRVPARDDNGHLHGYGPAGAHGELQLHRDRDRHGAARDHLPGRHRQAPRSRRVYGGGDVFADVLGRLPCDRRLRSAVGHRVSDRDDDGHLHGH